MIIYCEFETYFVKKNLRDKYVTLFWKTDHVVTFSILRNTDFKYSIGCGSPMVQYSHAKLTTLSSLVI